MISVWDAPDASYMNLRLQPPENNQERDVKTGLEIIGFQVSNLY
jgi:hypothetical protein